MNKCSFPLVRDRLIAGVDKFPITDFDKKQLKNQIGKFNDQELSYFYYERVFKEKGIYKQYPVDIHTFMHDPKYLGNIYQGNVYPIWEDLLLDIYPAPLLTKYDEVIVSCATRGGKSTVSSISMLYEIYKTLCMVDPAGFYLGKSTGRLVFGLLSFSEDNVKKYIKDIENTLTISPFFQENVTRDIAISNITKGGMHLTDNIIISAGSDEKRITGADLFCAVVDEINIKPKNTSEDDFVEKRVKLWDEILDRKTGTLSRAPAMSGIVWMISSPTEENDVINERITEVEKNKIDRVKILDNVSRWVAQNFIPKKEETFQFYLGSDTKDPQLLDDITDPENYIWGDILEEGIDYIKYESGVVLRVPVKDPTGIEDYRVWAREKTIHFIRNICGRRTSADIALFNSVAVFEKVFSKENKVFSKDIITINFLEGKQFGFEDYLLIPEYFKFCENKNCYRYVHMDIGTKKDRFGLASVYSDKVRFKSETGLEITKRMYFVDFCLGIVASPGCEVDIIKVFEFLYSIKKLGYPLKKVTSDSHQGILSVQHMKRNGVASELLSVEDTKDPYYNLKSLILMQSLVGYKNELLVKELSNLRDYDKKIDKNKGCTDDVAGALAGAVYSCSKDEHGFKRTDDVMEGIINYQTNNYHKVSKMTPVDMVKFINDINNFNNLSEDEQIKRLNNMGNMNVIDQSKKKNNGKLGRQW